MVIGGRCGVLAGFAIGPTGLFDGGGAGLCGARGECAPYGWYE